MINKKIITICALSLILSSSICGTLASFTTYKEVVNNAHFDTVDIELDDLTKTNDSSLEYYKPEPLVPSETASRIMKLSNKGTDCYVRVKLDLSISDKALKGITTEDLNNFISDNWKKCDDGYWYYTKVFTEEQSINLFDGVTLPSSWGNEYENTYLYIDVNADAIQSANFTPDFTSKNPWNNETIEDCVRQRDFRKGNDT